jgi:NAD(P)-dependent dehydrogenase (short-subunit alcohol dehydrogenase family)
MPVAIVTGSDSGIGKATAVILARQCQPDGGMLLMAAQANALVES